MTVELWRTRPYRLDEAIDHMFERAFVPFFAKGNGNGDVQSPIANVWETDEAYVAALLLPGLDEQSLNVTVHERTLAVEGEQRLQGPDGAKTLWQEIGPRKFRRSLRFGTAIDANKVEARYHDGVLMVTMPKAEHARPRRIEVRVAPSDQG